MILNKRWPEVCQNCWQTVAMLFTSTHLCPYICFVWRPRVHFVDLFSALETISLAIGKGLILCKCMQITVTQNSIHNHSMQMMFAKQTYWKDQYFPPLPPHFHPISSQSLSALPNWPCAFFSHFSFSPLFKSPLIPSLPFSLTWPATLPPGSFTLVSANAPTPPPSPSQ